MTNKATMIAFPEQKVTKTFLSTKGYKFYALNLYIFTHTEVFIILLFRISYKLLNLSYLIRFIVNLIN